MTWATFWARCEIDMHYGIAFLLIGIGFGAQALRFGSGWLLLLWPAVSFVVVGIAYISGRPELLGKRADGRLSPLAFTVLLPFTLFAWSVWTLRRLLRPGRPVACEVAPGVWLGRRAGLRELPPGIVTIVDLTAEFWEPRGVCDGNRCYICIPTLDATASDEPKFRAALDTIASANGPVYIHCAQGYGRSAALAAALLIRRGLAEDVEQAEAMLRKARPGVRMYARQRELVRRVAGAPTGVAVHVVGADRFRP